MRILCSTEDINFTFFFQALEEVYPSATEVDRVKIKELLLRINTAGGDISSNSQFLKSSMKGLLQGETIKEERPVERVTFETEFPRTRNTSCNFKVL